MARAAVKLDRCQNQYLPTGQDEVRSVTGTKPWGWLTRRAADDDSAVHPGLLPSGRSGRYVPGLDGLRAIAVIGVLLYHANVSWLPGGFLGVDLFFVISGYLITTLLLAEYHATGRISFKEFYLRRARRLLPALLTMLAVLVVFMALFHRTALGQARGDVLAALGYVSNWWYVLHHRSYFVASGRQSPLLHLWSLGIEEQFYLVWPPLLALLIAFRRRLRVVIGVALAGAIASSVWMAVLAVRGNVPFDTDSSRLYFGTDTHASGLLIGAAAAALVAAARRSMLWGAGAGRDTRLGARPESLTFPKNIMVFVDAVGLACLIIFCWQMHTLTEFKPGLYRGGFFGLAVLAVIVIVAVSMPGGRLGTALGVGPLRWIGKRSYGLYLWHWPVFVFTRPGLDWPLHGLADLVAKLLITAVLTEASFRLVEQPIRTRGLRGWLAPRPPTGSAELQIWRTTLPVLASAVGVAVIVAGVAGVGVLAGRSQNSRATAAVANSPSSSSSPGSMGPGGSFGSFGSGSTSGFGSPSANPSVLATPSHSSSPTPMLAPTPKPHSSHPSVPVGPTPSANATGVPAGPPPAVTALGDSIMVDASGTLSRICPGTEVHAVVGWQATAVFAELDALHAAGHLGHTVIIETGTNGIVSSKELGAALTMLADRTKVVVVNNHMDRPWEPPNNSMFPKVVAQHANAVLVNWDIVADLHPNYLSADGVHLEPAGRIVYSQLIQRAAGC